MEVAVKKGFYYIYLHTLMCPASRKYLLHRKSSLYGLVYIKLAAVSLCMHSVALMMSLGVSVGCVMIVAFAVFVA